MLGARAGVVGISSVTEQGLVNLPSRCLNGAVAAEGFPVNPRHWVSLSGSVFWRLNYLAHNGLVQMVLSGVQ